MSKSTSQRKIGKHGSMTAALCVLCCALFWAFGGPSAARSEQGPADGAPPPAVTVALVKEQEVNPPREFVGRMEAIQAVALRARVEGFLEKVAFREGADVKRGDLLYLIEQAPYQARFNEAQARVAESEAALNRARQYLQRLQTVKSGGVSATDLEAAQSAVQQAAARFEEAKANLEQARLNLAYTTIRAPIDGRIGRTNYTQGNLVGPASQPLAHIVQIDPIRVIYSMSEADLLETRMEDKKDDAPRNILKNGRVPRLKMANGEFYPQAGRIDFVDNQVDPRTGTIAVRAVFDNQRGLLLPGQFVTVRISLKEAKSLPMIPQSAVMEDREGRYVFTVDEQNAVELRRIVTGPIVQNQWAVESGLRPGEQIVVQGAQKVTPGQIVNPSFVDAGVQE